MGIGKSEMCRGGLIELKVVWVEPCRIHSGPNPVGWAEGTEVSGGQHLALRPLKVILNY